MRLSAKGSDSGGVHSTVKARWEAKDLDLLLGMKKLGDFADGAVEAIRRKDYSYLASLMDQNFALRRKLYGDVVVGRKNIEAVELLQSSGFGAKFSGSGGAILALKRDSSDWY